VIRPEVEMINKISNELAVAEVLLSAQQFPNALQLLTTIDSQVNRLPADNQTLLHATINSDKQRIQMAQSEREQLLGQLQQMQQHINQQMLTRVTQTTATPEASVTQPSFLERIKQKWNESVQVTHTESETTHPVAKVPDVYVAMMLQLSLQQAQFTLERGDWVGYQAALQSVEMWLTKTDNQWLPNAATLAETVKGLTQQSSPFINANVQATREALNTFN
jgi:hypothetical protein